MFKMKRINFCIYFSISCFGTSEVFLLGEINSTLFLFTTIIVWIIPQEYVCKAFKMVFSIDMETTKQQ